MLERSWVVMRLQLIVRVWVGKIGMRSSIVVVIGYATAIIIVTDAQWCICGILSVRETKSLLLLACSRGCNALSRRKSWKKRWRKLINKFLAFLDYFLKDNFSFSFWITLTSCADQWCRERSIYCRSSWGLCMGNEALDDFIGDRISVDFPVNYQQEFIESMPYLIQNFFNILLS